MYSNLILFRNELKNKSVSKYKLIGIIIELIYSKSIFKRNQDVAQFLEDTFNIKYKDYIISSRTLIAANVTQWLLGSENFMYKKELINFINIKI